MQAQLNSQYTQNGMNIAISIFNFPEDYSLDLRLKALRYLFSFHKKVKRPTKKDIVEHSLNFLKSLLSATVIVSFAVIELADILYIHAPETQQTVNELILNRERRIREVEEKRNKITVKTVYEDKQNVHNSTINKSVLSAAKNLIQKYKSFQLSLDEKNILIQSIQCMEEFKKYSKPLFYIRDSSGTFGEGITMLDTFISVWFFIQEKPAELQKELLTRLKEELDAMQGLCSTGHLSRIINVVQGYTDEFVVKISEKDRCQSIVNNYLTKALKECKDETVIDGMNLCSKEFLSFIDKKIAEKSPIWKKEESKEFFDFLPEIINNFCGNNK